MTVLNKIDGISIEELDLLYKIPNSVPISSREWLNIDELLETMWDKLDLVRVWVPFLFLTRPFLPCQTKRSLAASLAYVYSREKVQGQKVSETDLFRKPEVRHPKLIPRYTRPRGKQPDYTSPVVLRNGKNTVRHFCDAIHKNIVPNFKNGESGLRRSSFAFLSSFISITGSCHIAILLISCPTLGITHMREC